MKLAFLLDTNIFSELLKKNPDSGVVRHFESLRDSIAMAAPVWHEMVFGCRRLPPSKRRKALEEFLYDFLAPRIPILPYDEAAATWHAEERARLTALGRPPSFVDGQIAAVASIGGLTLVTRNARDFENFLALRTVSWHSG